MKNNETEIKDVEALLKQLTMKDFANIGLDQVAYIKKVDREEGDEPLYTVHAADGSQISVMDSYATALAAVQVNDLFAVTVH